MSIEIKVPVLPESVTDAQIATWHVKVGEKVSRDQSLVDIETDKVVLEVVAPEDGFISEFLFEEGALVLAEQVIAKFEPEAIAGEEISKKSAEQKPMQEQINAGPSARRLASEHDVNLDSIKGTGVGGKISKDDVQKSLDSSGSAAEIQDKKVNDAVLSDRSDKTIPMTKLRKTIASRLLEAKNSTAMLTTFNEVNMKPIMDIRAKYKDLFEKEHGVKLGFMSFYVKAVTEALKRFPDVNASIDGDNIVYHNYFDISIAVSTPRGLVTPVLRNTDMLSLAQIEKGVKELATKGRDGKLTIDDMTGGNFTITNGGVFGSLMSTPIINLPQSAILGMHAILDRPMAVNGEVKILPMMYLALSYDHRIVDGKESVGFLVTIKELLEDPTRILLDL